MCLITVKFDDDGIFTQRNFEASFQRNEHGTGIMYVQGGRVIVERTLGNLKEQRKLFLRHQHRDKYALHMRYATHGTKDLLNCHPYKILNIDEGDPIDLYMMHNGVISDAICTDKTMSDTWNFIENHIKPIVKVDHTLFYNAGFQAMISEFIGKSSKLVALDSEGEFTFFNKHQGDMVKNCWLSNKYSIAGSDYAANNTYSRNSNYGAPNLADDEVWANWRPETNDLPIFWHKGKGYTDMAEYQAAIAADKTASNVCSLPSAVVVEVTEPEIVITSGTEEDGTTYAQADFVTIDGTAEEVEEEEDESAIRDKELDELSQMVRSVYDPENIDKVQLGILVETMFKTFTAQDFYDLIEIEPEIAADAMEYMRDERISRNSIKAVA